MRTVPADARQDLDRIGRSDAARPLDAALGSWLAGLAHPESARAVALAGALLSWAAREGHSQVRLGEWAGALFPGEAPELPAFPSIEAWTSDLDASGVVGKPGDQTPLIRDGDALALYRYWAAERRVAARLRAMASDPDPLELTAETFQAHFSPTDGTDWQAVAAAGALRHRLAVVAGGPGTGKTYTVARMLAVARVARPELRVALAAPTGKAAQRLTESISAQSARLGDVAGEDGVGEAQTIHRLLGVGPDGSFRRSSASPVPADLVVLDEGSMIDLPLFDALLDALSPDTRLVLLGDPDQLASVEAGAVFGNVCAAGSGDASPAFAAFCAGLGLRVPHATEAGALADAVVTLRDSRRFGAASGIGALARSVQAGDVDESRAVLADPAFPDVRLASGDAGSEACAWALPFARAVASAETPGEALEALERFRLLAVVRRGTAGVEGLNAALENALEAEGLARAGQMFRGQPLLVTTNDYKVGLFNGDLGVAWTERGERSVWFPDRDGLRQVPLYRVPPFEAAWAMTVHKSQGSEADAIGVVLPPTGSTAAARLTRDLLYTAITRARRDVVVFGDVAVWEAGTRAATVRTSGLGAALAASVG